MSSFGFALSIGTAAAILAACQGQSVTPQPGGPVGGPAGNASEPLLHAQGPKHYPNYTVAILAGFGGNFDSATGLNESGDVAGFSLYPGTGPVHAAQWRNGTITDLGTLGGISSGLSFANEEHSINASDVITGSSETATPDPNAENKCGFASLECRAFLWKHGAMTSLPTLGGNNAVGAAINNRGQVVGVSETSTLLDCYSPIFLYDFFGFVWDKGRITELPAESGDQGTLASDINDRGDVVGTSGYCDVAAHSVLRKGGKIIDLGSLGGANGQLPSGINDREEVVGASDLPGDYHHHAFLWRRGHISDLGTLPGDVDSEAQNINNGGQIAGFSFDAYGNVRAVLWYGGAIYDLNTLVPPSSGIFLQEALDINARGQIAGFGCIKCDGSDQIPFLATPTGSYSSGKVTKSKLPLSGRSPVIVSNSLRKWGRRTGP